MAKDYAKFVPPKSRSTKKNTWHAGHTFAFMFVLLGVLASSYVVYAVKAQTTGTNVERMSVVWSKITTFVQHKKLALKTIPVTVVANNAPPPVRFDFYNELPNMQMPVDDSQNVASAPPPPPLSPSKPMPVAVSEPQPVPQDTAPVIPVAIKNKPIDATASVEKPAINADDVGDLLAAEHPAEQIVERYVVQLGIFQSEEAANKLREAITSVGFEATVVKVAHGKQKFYHVQQGPYENVASAKLSQQRLGKRGIVSVIQKLSA
jgi:cell division septation protein DedD